MAKKLNVRNTIKKLGGRPKGSGAYDPIMDHLAYVACAEGGFTIPKLAKLLNVSNDTISEWMRDHKSFSDAVQKGRDEFNCATAENCLLKRIKGYKYEEVTKEAILSAEGGSTLQVTKIVEKHQAPDSTSLIFFLRNRDRKRWPEIKSTEISGPDQGPIEVKAIPDELKEMIAYESKD